MQAAAEDAVDAIARGDGVEDRPDPVVAGNDGDEFGFEVTRWTRFQHVESRLIRTVEEEVVLHLRLRRRYRAAVPAATCER
jgi:hypothetical protein